MVAERSVCIKRLFEKKVQVSETSILVLVAKNNVLFNHCR